MLYLLDFRERDEGGAVTAGYLAQATGGKSGRQAEDQLRTEPEVVFVFHGYNVHRKKGTRRLTHLVDHMPALTGVAAVAVLWPGDHWTGAFSFPFEGRDADNTGDALARFIDRVIPAGTPISLVTHSLGARVAMETLKRLPLQRYSYPQICLMAAAIDDFSLASSKDYRGSAVQCGRIAVLSSKEDEVLRFAYPAGDLLQAFIFFWRERPGLALGYHGPRKSRSGEKIPANIIGERIPKATNSDHGDYLPEFSPGGHDPGDKSHRNQLHAASFANQVVSGVPSPRY